MRTVFRTNKSIVLVGPSCSGKDTLKERLKRDSAYKYSPPYTTRAPRKSEREGIDYHFVDERYIEDGIEKGEFIWRDQYNGWHYGYKYDQLEYSDLFIMPPSCIFSLNKLSKDNDKVFQYFSNMLIIFLDLDVEILRDRMKQRDDPNDTIDRRINEDIKDFNVFRESGLYTLRITNPNF